ncbi:hypothetical protein [Pseudaminobacter soli (ex Li et al. 2025)]|uniref:Uncharacterized protein n=1 Tax=Pseudaminobacter soli (ex Li et al. 2025) TaxID=1295366 RepID=A0A2P7SFG3_9HYPH|nr:hypothetical protein [Mesorhizobium soli]PSJ61228.1 hypothetical protein C7I85_09075 [Mesorhizobium soli]
MSLVLMQKRAPFQTSPASPSANLLAVANGVAKAADNGGLAATSSDDMFGTNTTDVTAKKVHLVERLAKSLGVEQEDYDSDAAFYKALKVEIAKLKRDPEGLNKIAAIEKDLGLTELGISLDMFMNAILDPSGDDAKRVDAALGKAAKDLAHGTAIEMDEIGIYRPAR